MTKEVNIASIEKATGRSWDSWLDFLDSINAKNLPHPEIAKAVHSQLTIESPGWWAQGITVAYEQHIGRRAPGQRNDGTFEASLTRTVSGNKETTYHKLLGLVESETEFNGLAITNARTSVTSVRSYWRCNLADGSQVAMAVEQRTKDKSILSITQTHMKTSEQAEKARGFWKTFLDKL